jgi:hypothetical protein
VPVVEGSKTGFAPIPPALDAQTATEDLPLIECYGKPVEDCTKVAGTGQSILLIGDSHAAMFIATFRKIAVQDHLTLSLAVRGLCPWQRNLYAPASVIGDMVAGGFQGVSNRDCEAFKDDLYTRVIPALDPDIIIAVDYADAYADPARATIETVRPLVRDGRKVILVEDPPNAPFDLRICMSKAKHLEECRYVANAALTPLETVYRQLDVENVDVYSADFDRLVCPYLPICDPVVNGQAVKLDATHLTFGFAESIAPQVNEYLKETVITASP